MAMLRVPWPLLVAAVVATSTVTVWVMVNFIVLGSYDPRYSAFNGTHVVSTAPMFTYSYRFLYGGPGVLTSESTATVYFLNIIRDTAYVKDHDLGKFLPVRVTVASGSLPKDTYISWNDPAYGRARKLYLFSASNVALIMGTYTTSLGTAGAAIVVWYYEESTGNVIFYPMARSEVSNPSSLCNVLKNAGFGTSANSLFTVVDSQQYDCGTNSWTSTTIRWGSVGSGTYLTLRPNPTYYLVRVTGTNYAVDLYLSYWYFSTTDPGFFAIRPG